MLHELALSGTQRLYLALSLQKVLVKKFHQFIGSSIFYGPETDDQGRGSGSKESPAQSQLFITSAAERQTGFTATQGYQFACTQVKAKGINSIELSISQAHIGEIRRI